MKEIEVHVESDHIQRITGAKPLAALSELIWNAYDADAHSVQVNFEEGELTKLARVLIEDDGVGIPYDSAEESFQSLGGSWKQTKRKTAGGRPIHGARGQGRFKAFALGADVNWVSSSGGKRFAVSGNVESLKRFSISDADQATKRGCLVEISNVYKDFEIREKDGFAEKVRDVFALQLFEDAAFEIIYDGKKIDAREAIKEVVPYPVEVIDSTGKIVSAVLEIVEWRKKVERKLLLCLPGRFSFLEIAPGIHARGFEFTAYLTSDYFQTLADQNVEALAELDPDAQKLIEAAKQQLRDHFRGREVERSRDKIQEWQSAEIYPYAGDVSTDVERNERQLFDVVALSLSDYSSEFERSSEGHKRLVLKLIRMAVESGPAEVAMILEQIIDLPKERRVDLIELMENTSLAAVISSAKAVTNRLDFVRALQLLIFEPKSKKQLLERSQLHRIIAKETWIFGEQFNLMNDDEDLTAVLRSHLRLLRGAEINELERVFDASGNVAIVDLMLSKRVPLPTDDQRHHLIVELKRPSQPINEDVLQQVRKYAKAVANDPRFKDTNTVWDFVAVSNTLTKEAESEARQSNRPIGLVSEYDDPKIRVWAKTWGQIIAEAQGRLTFYKRNLDYQANDEQALRYLSRISSEYLSEEIKAKIAELAD